MSSIERYYASTPVYAYMLLKQQMELVLGRQLTSDECFSIVYKVIYGNTKH